jgi:hypothetical protein
MNINGSKYQKYQLLSNSSLTSEAYILNEAGEPMMLAPQRMNNDFLFAENALDCDSSW